MPFSRRQRTKSVYCLAAPWTSNLRARRKRLVWEEGRGESAGLGSERWRRRAGAAAPVPGAEVDGACAARRALQ